MDMEEKIYKEALYSALKNKGQIRANTLLGVILKQYPEMKGDIEETKMIIGRICDDIAKKTFDQISSEAQKMGVVYEEKEKGRKPMIDLHVEGEFRTRLVPEPSKHLHVGHAIQFLINSIYAEKYGGSVVLRFEDTNPTMAKQEYVDSIMDDIVNYLKISPEMITYASDYMDDFYRKAEQLVSSKNAYVCTCDRDSMSLLRAKGENCPCRGIGCDENIKKWGMMLQGKYEQGEAVLRLRGDMKSSNMVMRDPVLFRIIREEHYRHKNKYTVWPVYDIENSVLDAEERITHILRSNEFGEMRTELQSHIRELLSLYQPKIIQYGRFEVVGAKTKGRELREAISKGMYAGWDDPRLYTLKSLRRKGISYLSLREIAEEVGLSPTPTRIDKKMLSTFNRRIIDRDSDRYSFIYDPMRIEIDGVKGVSVLLPLHPQDSSRGKREFKVNKKILIRKEDYTQGLLRLADIANIQIADNKIEYRGGSVEDFRKDGGKRIINWLPDDSLQIVRCSVIMEDASIKEGLVERNIKSEKIGNMVQLERFGFCRIEEMDNDEVKLIFAHK